MRRVNDTLYDLIDSETGENFNYSKITTYADGTAMTDEKCDGVIYRKLGSEYFKRNFTGAVNVTWFGAKGDGITDDSTAIKKAIESFSDEVYFPRGIFAVSNSVVGSLKNDVLIFGDGEIKWTGAISATSIIVLQLNYFSLTFSGLKFNGNNTIAGGLQIRNTLNIVADLPNFILKNCKFFDFKMKVASPFNFAAYIEGDFDVVNIEENTINNITRDAGTGTPSASGTCGISVGPFSPTKYVRNCYHTKNNYNNITGGDLLNSPNNVDYDAFKFFSPSPGGNLGAYSESLLISNGNTFTNCRGRAIKLQGNGNVSNEKIIRDADYTLIGGSSVEIDFQYGVGNVSNCTFIYKPYNGGLSSPIPLGINLISFFQVSNYGEDTASAMVNGIQVFNSINEGLGGLINSIVIFQVGGGVATNQKPIMTLSNVSVNKNAINYIATTGFESTTKGLVSLDNIVVPSIAISAVGTNGNDSNMNIVATNILNLEALSNPENKKNFVKNTLGAEVVYGGKLSGFNVQGFLTLIEAGLIPISTRH